MRRSLLGLLPQGGTLPEESWVRRHRGVVVLLWLHSAVIPIFALTMGYSMVHSLAESLLVPTAAVVASLSGLPRRVRTVAAALGLLSSSAVLVHLSGGLIEMHFHFFVMVVVVSLYQDWLPFLAAVGYVFVHHGLLGALDPRSVFNHPAAISHPWKWAAVHALFITGISLASLVNWRLNEAHLAQRRRAEDRLQEESRVVERLYAAERHAREQEAQARQRLAILAEAGRRLLSTANDLEGLLGEVQELVVPRLADGCCIHLVEDGGSVHPGIDSEDPDHPILRTIRSGHPELLEPGTGDLDRLAAAINFPEPLANALIAPLPGHDRVVGAMTLVMQRSSARLLGPDDLDLAETLARRVAAAAENAEVFAAQQEAAEMLQHSLLPDRLPLVPGMDMSARYLPGGAGVEIGGDWYDVIALPDGTVGLAMGDVVGKGIRAASLMGQLRNALRAYARDGRQPATVLEQLNELLTEVDSPDHMATLVFGVFDPCTGELTLANAGHLPPLLCRPDGTTEYLQCGPGLPLGALPESSYTDRTFTIAPGSTVLLYTDGLVEGRELPLDDGLERLRTRMSGQADCETVCDVVLDGVTVGGANRDDTAVLAVRYLTLGDELHLSLPARPGTLKPLRNLLRRWLREGGATEAEISDILVAAGEACANVVRHAPAGDPAILELDSRRDGDISITVRNQGRWRTGSRPDDGGRGLAIIEELMDEVEITRGPPETTVTMRYALGDRQPVRLS